MIPDRSLSFARTCAVPARRPGSRARRRSLPLTSTQRHTPPEERRASVPPQPRAGTAGLQSRTERTHSRSSFSRTPASRQSRSELRSRRAFSAASATGSSACLRMVHSPVLVQDINPSFQRYLRYWVCGGRPPFPSVDLHQRARNVRRGRLRFPPCPPLVPPDARVPMLRSGPPLLCTMLNLLLTTRHLFLGVALLPRAQ